MNLLSQNKSLKPCAKQQAIATWQNGLITDNRLIIGILNSMADKKEALPTQQFIEIDSVRNGTLVLKNGGLRQILLVTGINFDLKSEEEQGMILGLFQNFLNSLDFSLQIYTEQYWYLIFIYKADNK